MDFSILGVYIIMLTTIQKIKNNQNIDDTATTGLLHPDGSISPTYDHEIDCKTAHTTLMTYLKAKGLRICCKYDQFIVEGFYPEITDEQYRTLKRIIRQNKNIGTLTICLRGRSEFVESFTNIKQYHLDKLLQLF